MNYLSRILLSVISLMAFLCTSETYAQEAYMLKGQVVDQEGMPLPGVTIVINGNESTKGTITDFDGMYKLMVKTSDVITYSFIGHKPQSVTITSQTELNIRLAEEASQLDEIVVVGYGAVQKSHLTGAVSKVTSDKMDEIPAARLDDALAGQVSGVNIQMTNPTAGEAPTIRVRGVGSITSFPNPLIVVDGVVVDQDYMSTLDMNDVESIEILKDASSAAIYGSRGSNGVILITNKKGKEGSASFNYNGFFGVKQVPGNDVLKTVGEWNAFVRENNEGELTDKMRYRNNFV